MTYTLIRTKLQVWDQILDEPVKGTVVVTPSTSPIKDVAGNRLLFSPNVVHLDDMGWYEADLPASDDAALTPTGFGYTFDIRAKGFSYEFTTQVRLADATLVTEVNPETLEEYTHYELDLTGLAPVAPDVPISVAQVLRDETVAAHDETLDARDETLVARDEAVTSANSTTLGRRVTPDMSLASEDALALAAGVPLLLAPGTHSITADLTIASAVVMSAGAKFSVAATKTLTLSGYVVGPPFTQVFTGVGAVVLTKAQTVYADYWGQKGAQTAGTDTIQRAFDCTAQGTEIRIAGKYWTTGINIHADEDLGTGDQGKSLVGIAGPGVRSRNTTGNWGAEIYLADSQHRDVINVTGVRTATDQPSRFSVKLDGFKINGNKANQTAGAGLTLASVKDFYIGRLVIESCKGDGLEGAVVNGSCNQVEWDHLEIMACDGKGADFGAIGDSHGNYLLLGSNADIGAQFAGAVQVNQVHSYLNGVGLVLMGDRTQLGLVRVNDCKAEGVRIATGAVDNVITHLDVRDNGTDTALTAPSRAGLRVMGTATKNHIMSLVGSSSNGTQQYGVRYDSTLSGTLNTIGRYAATGNALAEVSTAAGVPASNVALIVNDAFRSPKGAPFNVLNFGATPDGVTDCSDAINAAILEAEAAGPGATVLIPWSLGEFAVGSLLRIKSGVRLRIDGTIKLLAAHTTQAILGTNVDNVVIEGSGTIDLNKADPVTNPSGTIDRGLNTTQQAIYLSYTVAGSYANLTIRDITIKNGWQRGITVNATTPDTAFTNVTIDNVTITDVGETGIFVGSIGQADRSRSEAHGIVVKDCTVTNPGNGGIQVMGCSDILIRHNRLDGGGIGAATSHGITLGTSGANRHSTDFEVSGNRVRGFNDPAGGSGPWGICLTVNATRFTVRDNMVDDCFGGITCDPEDGAVPDVEVNVAGVIADNVVTNSTGSHGINSRMNNGLTLRGNTCEGGAACGLAAANASGTKIIGNVTKGNANHGIALFGTDSGGGHLLVGNETSGNNTAAGSWLDFYNAGVPVPIKFVDRKSGKLDPRDFGAVGDGVALDSAPLRAAVDAATAVGMAVDLSEGVYLVDEDGSTFGCLNLPSGARLQGSGTIKLDAASVRTIVATGNPASVRPIQILGQSDITISDITIDMDDFGVLISGTQGIFIDNSSDINLYRVKLPKCGNGAIMLSGVTTDVEIVDCKATTQQNGVTFYGNDTDNPCGVNNVLVSGCTFVCGVQPIDSEPIGGFASDVRLLGNHFETTSDNYAVTMSASAGAMNEGWLVQGNTLIGALWVVNAKDSVISGNTIDARNSPSCNAVHGWFASNNITLSDNQIFAPAGMSGVSLNRSVISGTSYRPTGWVVSGNQVRTLGTTGVIGIDVSGAGPTVVTGNLVRGENGETGIRVRSTVEMESAIVSGNDVDGFATGIYGQAFSTFAIKLLVITGNSVKNSQATPTLTGGIRLTGGTLLLQLSISGNLIDTVFGTLAYVGWTEPRVATTAQLNSITHPVNTTGKRQGLDYFNSSTKKTLRAAGSAPGDVWYDATGVVAHTPA